MTLSMDEKNFLIASIRDIPDFPKPGIVFKDITTLLANKDAYALLMTHLAKRYGNYNLTHVAGIDARGFIFGSALAQMLGIGFVPIRKKGKLPTLPYPKNIHWNTVLTKSKYILTHLPESIRLKSF